MQIDTVKKVSSIHSLPSSSLSALSTCNVTNAQDYFP